MRSTKILTAGLALVAMTMTAMAGQRGDGGVAQMENELKQAQLPADAQQQIAKMFGDVSFDQAFLDKVKLGNHDLRLDFQQDGADFSAIFSDDGKLIGVAEAIDAMDLPQDIKDRIKKAMPNARVTNAEMVTSGNEVSYSVEVENREFGQTVVMQLTFDESGKLVLQ